MTWDCAPIIDGLVAVTVTPGRTAPLLSAARPWIVPVLLAPPPCAALIDGNINPNASATARTFNPNFISIPPKNGMWDALTTQTNQPGIVTGSPFFVNTIARNFAACVWLAFPDVECVWPGASNDSKNISPALMTEGG